MERDPLSESSLPSDIGAEKTILGAISLNDELIAQALDLLETDDFYLDSHRKIFDAMVSLKKSGNPVDTVTLPRLLADRRELEQVGGVTYLAMLIDGVPQTDNIEHYCRIIKYKARERNTIKLLNHELSQLIDGEEELDAALERIQSNLAKISESAKHRRSITGVYSSLNTFFEAKLEEPEQILFGLHRGEVAGLFAVTNYGKTTLLYNTALSIAAGETLWPLAPTVPKPRHVLYIDSESPASLSRADLKTMISDISDDKAACENFSIVVDAAIKDSPLSLSKPDHFKWIVALAKSRKADLVVIDTAASAFELQDENSNAEITRRVMNPLKQLAREANCAVIFTHHIGKANETQSGEAAYKGRGASAFGALSRTIFTIEKDAKKGPGYIVLSCAKVKGQQFEPVLLKLNSDTRWFERCYDSPSAKPEPPTAQEVSNYVKERTEARTAEICSHFKPRAGKRTIEDRIKEAERLGLIVKEHQKAPWRSRNGKNGDSSDSTEAEAESTNNEFPQSASPIRDCGNAETRLNGNNQASELDCYPTCGSEGICFSDYHKCGDFIR
jgi:replicative DNA helicase